MDTPQTMPMITEPPADQQTELSLAAALPDLAADAPLSVAGEPADGGGAGAPHAAEGVSPAAAGLPGERELLRALLRAGHPVDEGSGLAMSWGSLAFEPARLLQELTRVLPDGSLEADPALRQRLEATAEELSIHYRMQVARVDDLHLPLAGRQVRVPRFVLGEALGPLGADLFPTRQRAHRLATEAAREQAYFGFGKIDEQFLTSPLALLQAALSGGERPQAEPVLLDEQGPAERRRWTAFELLTADRYFNRKVGSRSELARLQQRLREDPLDGTMVNKLRDFFARRLTIGARDTLRWALGSRHPWFEWRHARELLENCFERWGAENFLSPRSTLYTWDVDFSDKQLQELLEANRRAAELFAERLAEDLPPSVVELLQPDALAQLAAAALDYHCDHPDFDSEAAGNQQGGTSARFLGRAALDLAKNLAGWEQEPLRNVNFAGQFEALGLADSLLGPLDARQRGQVYVALRHQIRRFVAQSGGRDGHGRTPGYHRPPFMLVTFCEAPTPRPREGETVLDSFRLSELRSPRYSQYLRRHPEIVGKLVVYFTLVLRHYLDTDHVPDLRPDNLVRDFMMLGIWGYDTRNLVVNLYQQGGAEGEQGELRSEVRFLGRTQIKRYRPEEDRTNEAALVRKAVSQLGPLLEPSMLRALGNFLMAYEEATEGLRNRPSSKVAVARHALEMFRETAREGLKAGLVDVATILEVLVDDGVDGAQRVLDKVDHALDDDDDDDSGGAA